MTAMDALNGRYGKGTLHVASTGVEGPSREWGMRQERRTPHYTTSWDEMPVARA
jgi:DNA polymerase V